MVTQAIHLYRPTIGKIRGAVQSLAARNHHPFEGHLFHGLIDKFSFEDVLDSFKQIGPIAGHVHRYESEGQEFAEVPGSGVLFRLTEAVRGAIIYAEHSDLLQVESR